jgi:hypothetical protein
MLAFTGKERVPDLTPYGCSLGNLVNVGKWMPWRGVREAGAER